MIADELKDFVQTELLTGKEVDTDENLLTSGLVDSLGVVRILTFIETRWGFKVPAGDVKLANFRSIEAMADYLGGRGAAGA